MNKTNEINKINKTDKIDKTLEYYNANAENFVSGTVGVEFTDIQDKFLDCLPRTAKVLDFGCGSGRDTKYFVDRGLEVDAIDGSEKLCEIASQYAGIKVKHMLFQEFSEHEKYDGIWACASILHLPKDQIEKVFGLIYEALKIGGIFYASFKYGEFSGERNGRIFTDFTEETMAKLLEKFPQFSVREQWLTQDVRPEKGDTKWLNIILQKNQPV